MDEQWRDVDGYEGLYQVSNKGRVRSLDRMSSNGRRIKGVVLRPAPNSKGYLCVNLHNNGDGGHSHLVHRLVAEAFHPNNGKPQINHRNANKRDNRAANLEWVTRLENASHAREHGLVARGERNGRAKLAADDVREIRTLCADGHAKREVAARFGIDPLYINQLLRRTCWKHI